MKRYRVQKKLMGSVFDLIIVHPNESFAEKSLQKGIEEIERLEDKLSEFRPASLTSAINRYAGIKPIKVDEETLLLIKRSIQLSQLTQGAFDITAPTLHQLYDFKNREMTFPSQKEISQKLAVSGYKNVVLTSDGEVFLKYKGMRINFAANGKGYAADCVKKLWQHMGVRNGVVNASGDLSVLGKNQLGEAWQVGIANPEKKDTLLFHIPLKGASIATSGNYEQYFRYKGKTYAHTINPASGLPLTDINSTSIISKSAELSDALATAVSVMGADVGLHFINQLPDTHAIIVSHTNKVVCSDKIQVNYEKV